MLLSVYIVFLIKYFSISDKKINKNSFFLKFTFIFVEHPRPIALFFGFFPSLGKRQRIIRFDSVFSVNTFRKKKADRGFVIAKFSQYPALPFSRAIPFRTAHTNVKKRANKQRRKLVFYLRMSFIHFFFQYKSKQLFSALLIPNLRQFFHSFHLYGYQHVR